MSVLGIYHSKDLDGLCCGAIIRHKYPDAELVGYDYGEAFDMSIVRGKDVIMADVSVPMATMFEIAKQAKTFLWVDHHATAIGEYRRAANDFFADLALDYDEDMFGREFGIVAILETGLSACELTWKTLFPEQNTPEAVTLLGKYDTWREYGTDEWNNRILPFQYAMRVQADCVEWVPNVLFNSDMQLAGSYIKDFIGEGRIILNYQDQQNEKLASHSAFEALLGAHRCIALNTPVDVSRVLRTVYDANRHELMVCFSFNGTDWVFSLRSEREDVYCGEIAKRYGGGGHKGAAGFKTKVDPHKIITILK